ncbi:MULTISPECIES: serine--tRNA ligase [Thermoactinomyces]|uniref:Serine--tRNA ligase n=1 Tax=Thermoactinomyces vulgaris TaxID=2026 RepID=A0ABS0QGV7_THEVU|nr:MULTISPECIES: serine--tRNA ligase [Thermoactinomyces]MBH8586102.1 serine--tRNA ligase [Thermoactinomyces sp. CICC 10520]MBI0392270.1 serine--tRNA ligase [Thermoactinomyces sp. CICC 24226]KFZ39418.1 seryl-tRNA synthetase [Thermoactinomyces sp. Gus2-1]MBA4551172.1 serine--tRNA ligase [Thermoactinomyces vulgaris]MBA4596869.1 serine--tRNA ligase [Thermoactinomyces vulgaris]
MLDMKILRNQMEDVKKKLSTRNDELEGLRAFTELDQRRRALIQQSEQLKNKRNVVSKEISQKKKNNEDAEDKIKEMRQVGEEIKRLDEELRRYEEEMNQILLQLPNIPHESVPVGKSEEENEVVRTWGEVPAPSFEQKPHWELAEELDLLDFERAAKVTGSRFVFYKGLGARLERALIDFMLDLHTREHGYTEIIPPYIVNRRTMTGTGQLPKFENDAFKLAENTDYFLIPTSEVPVINYHAGEILSLEDLPKYYTAYSSCFRSEAGSAGRDTRGLIRLHQFNKVELLKLVHPESSYEELEKMVENAEKVLQLLELPYRVVALCTGDLGFSAAKTYDLEVWMPSNQSYREISSCSNCEDFQARRAQIRFRPGPKSKPEYVHTLNGSGLAVGRTVAAILENHQQADGTIRIPEALRPYMGGIEKIG